MSRTPSKTTRKAKRSYTLSPEVVAFLEGIRKKRRAGSTSAILEEILQTVRRQQELVSIDRAVNQYYSSLTDAEVEEDARWGEFALAQFSRDGEA
jgi:hypothetical protein